MVHEEGRGDRPVRIIANLPPFTQIRLKGVGDFKQGPKKINALKSLATNSMMILQ